MLDWPGGVVGTRKLSARISEATYTKVMRILVVDHQQDSRESLRRSLSFNGYSVILAADGSEAFAAMNEQDITLAIINRTLPDIDGLEICRCLRSEGNTLPILMLAPVRSVAERVGGLDAGADDYLEIPYALEELLARVRALIRRAATISDSQTPDIKFGDLTLSHDRHEVSRGGHSIALTRTEFALLELFMNHPRRVLEKSFIMDRVWNNEFPASGNALEVYVGYLRRKTEMGGQSRMIHTVRGVGYVLRSNEMNEAE